MALRSLVADRRRTTQLAPYLPSDDPFSRPTARRSRRGERTRWLWLVPLAAGFAAVLGWVLTHDPGRGLSDRGFATIVLAATVVVALTAHRADTWHRFALTRAVAEFAAVATLAVLLATAMPAGHAPADPAAPPPAASATGAGAGAVWDAPRCVHMRGWTACVWHRSPTRQQGEGGQP
jgi:hypothetical protein